MVVLEEQTVRSLAEHLWRKNRLDVFAHARAAKQLNEVQSELLETLIQSAEQFRGKPTEFRKHVLQKPELQRAVVWNAQLFGDVGDCFETVQKRSHSLKTIADAFGLKVNDVLKELVAPTNNAWALLADTLTPELFEKELAIRARLDDATDRLVKRLLFLKAGKRMAGLNSPKALPKPNETVSSSCGPA
jgi:hypothetical protein